MQPVDPHGLLLHANSEWGVAVWEGHICIQVGEPGLLVQDGSGVQMQRISGTKALTYPTPLVLGLPTSVGWRTRSSKAKRHQDQGQ